MVGCLSHDRRDFPTRLQGLWPLISGICCMTVWIHLTWCAWSGWYLYHNEWTTTQLMEVCSASHFVVGFGCELCEAELEQGTCGQTFKKKEDPGVQRHNQSVLCALAKYGMFIIIKN